jgi:uncharacterized membrane protein
MSVRSWPTVVVAVVFIVAVTVAYIAGPAEHKAELVSTLGGLGVVVAAIMERAFGAKSK